MRVVDAGCGQGLVGALFAGRIAYRGIELDRRDAERASAAMPGAEIVHGDIRSTDFGASDVVRYDAIWIQL